MSAVPLDQLELADVHDLGHELQVVPVGGAPQQPQPLFAESLEAVGRAARLERAAAQDLRARALDRGGRRLDLLLGLGRARARHDDHLVAADAHVADRDDRVLRLERAARELVGLGDPHDLLHAVEHFEQRADRPADVPPTAPITVRSAPRRPVHVESHLDQAAR